GQSLVGHLNQLQAAAWLPWAALLADRAWLRRAWRLAGGLGVVLALQVLAGHAQQSYMTAAALGVWLVGRALAGRGRSGLGRALGRAAAVLGLAGAVAGLLAAVALGALLLGVGQLDPLYPVLYRVVPGLGLFRVPARWLFVYGFAAAMLVALGVEALGACGCARRTLVRLGGFAGLAAAPF